GKFSLSKTIYSNHTTLGSVSHIASHSESSLPNQTAPFRAFRRPTYCPVILSRSSHRPFSLIISCPRSQRSQRLYTLNIWDVGGQKTIRSYWRNYFEQTDGLVWVVDSSDLRRLDDCKMELDNLLKEERLSGASLLILANKQDIKGALAPDEIAKVSLILSGSFSLT
ncbi:ADP-ribosylation factor-like protein 2, partial [Lathyrus oleraceus]